jgi:hypothetical protein
MANNQSWEFYQQPDSGTKYPLEWIAGVSTPAPLGQNTLTPNKLFLIPFNQMRIATVSKMGIDLKVTGGVGAKLRLGIYANNGSRDNYATTLLLDAGEFDVSPAGGLPIGCNYLINLNQALAADNRYWAAVLTNDNSVQIATIPTQDMIFWGAFAQDRSTLQINTFAQVTQDYGPLPSPAPNFGFGDLKTADFAPAIILAFSAVT